MPLLNIHMYMTNNDNINWLTVQSMNASRRSNGLQAASKSLLWCPPSVPRAYPCHRREVSALTLLSALQDEIDYFIFFHFLSDTA